MNYCKLCNDMQFRPCSHVPFSTFPPLGTSLYSLFSFSPPRISRPSASLPFITPPVWPNDVFSSSDGNYVMMMNNGSESAYYWDSYKRTHTQACDELSLLPDLWKSHFPSFVFISSIFYFPCLCDYTHTLDPNPVACPSMSTLFFYSNPSTRC